MLFTQVNNVASKYKTCKALKCPILSWDVPTSFHNIVPAFSGEEGKSGLANLAWKVETEMVCPILGLVKGQWQCSY